MSSTKHKISASICDTATKPLYLPLRREAFSLHFIPHTLFSSLKFGQSLSYLFHMLFDTDIVPEGGYLALWV